MKYQEPLLRLQVTYNEAIAMHAAIVHYIRYFPPQSPMSQLLQQFHQRMIDQLPKTRPAAGRPDR